MIKVFKQESGMILFALYTVKELQRKDLKMNGGDFLKSNGIFKKAIWGASLVVQWLRICLPMQGTRVRALVWEDPTCRGATRPVSHNY